MQIGDDYDWAEVVAGGRHTVALKKDGSLYAWGVNESGQLGVGNTAEKHEPQKIGDASDWSAVAAGWNFTFALKRNGTLWSWGYNDYGDLGDGTTTSKTEPVLIGEDWTAIATTAGNHAVALKSDGSLWTWGANWYGQLGDGTFDDKLSPVRIGSDNDWESVSAGGFSTMAIKTDGSLWAWGENWGQLGGGETDGYILTPVQIGNDRDWASVSMGWGHEIALKQDGTIWSWGENYAGQLGDGTFDYRYIPAKVEVSNVMSLALLKEDSSFVIRADGSLWGWGNNCNGQLGMGSTEDTPVPVQIKILSGTSGLIINHGALSAKFASVTLSYMAFDQNDVAEMQFSNGNNIWSDPEPYVNTKNWTLSDGEGTKTVYARFKDTAGNWSQAYSASIQYAASVTITGVTEGAYYKTDVTPLVTISDSNLAGQTITLNGAPYDPGSSAPLSADNTYFLSVSVWDQAGNTTTKNVTFTIDKTPPAITIANVANGATYTSAATPHIEIADLHLASSSITLNGQPYISDTPITANGQYTLTVTANDLSANQSTITVTFTIDERYLLAAQWQKSYELRDYSRGASIAVDSTGNYYIVGGSDYAYGYDVVKHDSSGNVLWSRAFTDPDVRTQFSAGIAIDSSDNVYLLGSIWVTDAISHYQFQVVKYDSSGTLQWSRIYDHGWRYDMAERIIIDSADNVYMMGRSCQSYNPSCDVLVVKYDATGNLQTNFEYNFSAIPSINSTAVDKNNNLYINLKSFVDSTSLLLKYTPSGNIVWSKDVGTSWGAGSIAVDTDENVYFATNTSTGDYRTIKFDQHGDILWNNTYDGGQFEVPTAITIDKGGNVIVTGTTAINDISQGFLTAKYSPDGNVIWSDFTYGGYQHRPFGIVADKNDAIYVAGAYQSNSWGGGYNVIKYVPSHLQIITRSIPFVTTGSLYVQDLNASGDGLPCSWSVVSGRLPDGIILSNDTGVISGTTTEVGDFFFTVQATDSRNSSVVQTLLLRVYTPLVITTSSLPLQRINTSYNQTVEVMGGLPPYTWSITSGELPGGLSLNNSTGEISGTLAAWGRFDFLIRVTDKNNSWVEKAFGFNVEEISIATESLAKGTLGVAYNQTLDAATYVNYGVAGWSITGGTLPSGLTFDTISGLISGVPTIAGHFDITIQVTDTNGYSTSKSFELLIADVTEQWVRFYDGQDGTFDDYAKKIGLDSAGNIYVTGSTFNGTNIDNVTIKYDPAGNVLWTQRFDTNSDEWVSAMQVDKDDNLYVMVSTWDYQLWTQIAYTIKYSSNGDILWQHSDSGWSPLGIRVDSENNLYISERMFDGENTISRTAKYGTNGVEQWHWDYAWNSEHFFNGMTIDGSGNIYLAGSTGSGSIVTVKYDLLSATVAWTRIHEGGDQWTNGNIAVDGNGNVYVAGTESNPQTNEHYLLLKYDASGNKQWAGRYEQPGGGGGVDALATDAVGNIYLSGHFARGDDYADIVTVKYDPTGAIQWSKAYSSGIQYDFEEAGGIAVDPNGNVYITGNSHQSPTGSYDYITIKYTKVGQGVP